MEMIQDLRGRIELLEAFMSEQETLFHNIKDNCKKRHEDLVLWKKEVAERFISWGRF
jgi:hypothetical protein